MSGKQGQRAQRKGAKDARRRAVVAKKVAAEVAQTHLSLAARVRAAAAAPVESCLVTDKIFEIGMGCLVLSRRLPSGHVVMSTFLLDIFCLGVKDVLCREEPLGRYHELVEGMSEMERLVDIAPERARALVNQAAAYAADLGLPPPTNFRAIEAAFGDIVAAEERFTFGREGKPLYIPGPHDSPARARRILRVLEARQGEAPMLEQRPEDEE